MKRIILLCSLLLPAMMSLWAQIDLRNSISYFEQGYNEWCAGLTFNNYVFCPTPFTVSSTEFGNANNYGWGRHHATVSDPNGNELFTTDGVNVWMYTQIGEHLLLSGQLNGGNFSDNYTDGYFQNVIIVPRPLHPMSYYVVNIAPGGGVYYTEVDLEAMTLKNLNTPLKIADGAIFNSSSRGGITATTNSNGVDYWLVAHSNATNNEALCTYKVTANGINPIPVETLATPFSSAGNSVKISNTGNTIERFALACDGAFYYGTFNRATGKMVYDNYMTIALEPIYSNTLSVEFAGNNLFVLYYDGSLYKNDSLLTTNTDYKSLQIGPDGKLYVSGMMHGVHIYNPQCSDGCSTPIQISLIGGNPLTSAMAQLVPFNECFVPALPTFNEITLFDQNVANYPLPTTSLNGIIGTWNPPTAQQGENDYVFTPEEGQCAAEVTVSLLAVNTNKLDANEDNFGLNQLAYIGEYIASPSVLQNDRYNNEQATTNNVTVSFVSLEGENLKSEDDFSLAANQTYTYAEFFTPDGRYTFLNPLVQFYNPGDYKLTYKIQSKKCPSDFTIATAIIHLGNSTAKSTHNLEVSNPINVYPNPSEGFFNIDLAGVNENYDTVQVFNILGAKVYESIIKARALNAIDISGMPTGYYMARLTGEGASTTVKLIKQ